MATQIINKATLEYKSGSNPKSAVSNTTTVSLQGPLEVVIHVLENVYQLNDELTYNYIITNTGTNPLTNVQLVDNLGTYEYKTGSAVTPFTYVGPAKHLKHDTTSTELDADTATAGKVVFTLAALPAKDTAIIQYKVRTNEYALGASGSKITTAAEVTADGINTPVKASKEVTVADYADLVIEKSMSPDPVVDGNPLTYTFKLQNYGNIDATSTIFKDTFVPAPKDISMTINGIQVDPAFYSIDADGKFEYPEASQTSADYTIKSAVYKQNPETGFFFTIAYITLLLQWNAILQMQVRIQLSMKYS